MTQIPPIRGRTELIELIEQRGFVTRPVPASRVAQAYLPVNEAAYRPSPITYMALLAMAFAAGWCLAAAGL